MSKRTRKLLAAASLIIAALAALAPMATAQSIPAQVVALYPQRAGEVVFADLRALRASKHYAQLKTQVLPERFRQLEQWARFLGIDFDSQIQQISWAFVSGEGADFKTGAGVDLVGVAEGTFAPAQVEQQARRQRLGVTRSGDAAIISLGKNSAGQDFVFAFVDGSAAIFGARPVVEEMVTRRAQGGANLSANPVMRDLIAQLNGKAPMWVALDKQFSALALRQMLPEASQVPGFDDVAGRVASASIRFELKDGLRSSAAIRCRDASDALLFSTATQAAVAYQALRIGDTNPELSRVLNNVRLNRQDDRLDIDLTMAEPDFVALLQKNSFVLKF